MPNAETKLATIVFTDIVDFTRLSAENEPLALQLLDTQRDTLKPIIERHNGSWLKEIGDGLLLSFNTTTDAVECCIEIQHTIKNLANLNLGLEWTVYLQKVSSQERKPLYELFRNHGSGIKN